MKVQDECIKIHSKYGMSEMANYKIQLLFDSEIEKVKKEYEDKLLWIPVEEKLPEKENKNGNLLSTSKVVQVKSINFSEPFCAFYNYVQKCWVSYPYLSGSEMHGITSWRSFL